MQLISVSDALALTSSTSLESAPWGRLDCRTLSVIAKISYQIAWGHASKPWKLAELRFTAQGVEVHYSPLPHDPRMATAVQPHLDALKVKVDALPPAVPGWRLESGGSSNGGAWHRITAPDGRTWALSNRDCPKGVNPRDGLVIGPMVAPEGMEEYNRPQFRGDFSSGPFSRECPVYEIADPGAKTPWMKWAEVVKQALAHPACYRWRVGAYWNGLPERAWEDQDCGTESAVIARAILHGRPIPDEAAIQREMNRATIKAALEKYECSHLPQEGGGNTFSVPTMEVMKQYHSNILDELGGAVRKLGRIPTVEEWAACGWAI